MFLYELVNSTRKFTIVAEIVSLLKKIYKRDAPFRAVFKVKTLAVLFSAYPCEMKHIPRNLNLPPFWRYLVSIFWRYLGAIHSHTRGLSMRTHLTAGVGPARWTRFLGADQKERGLWGRECLCRPRLVEDVISPVLPSCRKREYFALVLPRQMFQSTLFSVILIRMFLRFTFFTIVVYNTTLR